MAEWYSVEDEEAQDRLGKAWPDAPLSNLEVCEFILEVARGDVVAYAPAPTGEASLEGGYITVTEDPPARYVYAQLRWAMNIYDAGRGELGPEGFEYTPRILDREIKRIIRPADGKPHVL